MTDGPIIREARGLELVWMRVKWWWRYHILRRVPTLVWDGDEIDVRVTFREARLPDFKITEDGHGFEAALQYLNKGQLAQVERLLGEIGIDFDKGGGPGGRDWEWDYSLAGPISVRFRRRAAKPERRQ